MEHWTPQETNRRYGHADDCLFGTQNSGFCSCGRVPGFKIGGREPGEWAKQALPKDRPEKA
jgi:hypothetical protein